MMLVILSSAESDPPRHIDLLCDYTFTAQVYISVSHQQIFLLIFFNKLIPKHNQVIRIRVSAAFIELTAY